MIGWEAVAFFEVLAMSALRTFVVAADLNDVSAVTKNLCHLLPLPGYKRCIYA